MSRDSLLRAEVTTRSASSYPRHPGPRSHTAIPLLAATSVPAGDPRRSAAVPRPGYGTPPAGAPGASAPAGGPAARAASPGPAGLVAHGPAEWGSVAAVPGYGGAGGNGLNQLARVAGS
jgi:hypothetical protein